MTAFWLEDPIVLFQQPSVKEIWPLADMCRIRKLNAVSRMVIIMTVIGYAISRRSAILVSGLVALVITSIVWLKGRNQEASEVEGLTSIGGNKKALSDLVGAPVATPPKENNPMMNVLIPQINDDTNDTGFQERIQSPLEFRRCCRVDVSSYTNDGNVTLRSNLFNGYRYAFHRIVLLRIK